MTDKAGKIGLPQIMNLVLPLIRREIGSRYRASLLGLAWPFIVPLFMLGIYTFAFGVVMGARWNIPGREAAGHSTAEFAVILFAGLILQQFFSEVISSAPGLIVGNANYVKKVVFPIHILPIVSLGTALFHAMVSASILLVFVAIVFGLSFPALLCAPLAFVIFVPLILGLAWFLAAAGVYFRDIGQILPPLLTAMLFLSPTLFPRSSFPEVMQRFVVLNPLTVPVETFRNAVIFGKTPDWLALSLYMMIALVIAAAGLGFFNLVRRGFADVL